MISFQRPWFIAGGWTIDLAVAEMLIDHMSIRLGNCSLRVRAQEQWMNMILGFISIESMTITQNNGDYRASWKRRMDPVNCITAQNILNVITRKTDNRRKAMEGDIRMHEKIAIISDIHSNSYALEAVLQDIAARDVQIIVNLGDSLYGPIDPIGTAKQLMGNNNMINIMGNCDQLLLNEESKFATFNFVKPMLNQDITDWIRSFQDTWVYEDLLFCHGTPFVNDQYLLEEVDENRVCYKDPYQLSQELEGVTQKYVFCGHSHVFGMVYLPNGKFIVNAGSVGLPAYRDELPYPHVMESKSPCAEYVIAQKNAQNSWIIEHLMIHYDWDQASSIAEINGRNDYAFALRTGRAFAE